MDNQDKEILSSEIEDFITVADDFKFLYGNYEYYVALDEFVEGYYTAGNREGARALLEDIAQEYDERLALLAGMESDRQAFDYDRIIEEIDGYRKLMLFASLYDDEAYQNALEARIFKAIRPLEAFEQLIAGED